MSGPLEGVRVVELGMGIQGPLAHMGAEVIKIEPPTGDGTRFNLGPIDFPMRGANGLPASN